MYSGAQTKSEREGIDSVREEGRALNWRTPKNAVQIPFYHKLCWGEHSTTALFKCFYKAGEQENTMSEYKLL